MGRLRCCHFKHIVAPSKITSYKLIPIQTEILDDERHRRLYFSKSQSCIFGHYVDLDDLVLVMERKFSVIRFLELATACLRVELNVHCGAEYCFPTSKMQHFVGIEIDQRCSQSHV